MRTTQRSSSDPRVISYLTLRRALGAVGIALPFVLAVGHILAVRRFELKMSVSHYYYTEMRNVFVGGLCVIAAFLLAYRGYDDLDSLVSIGAGALALGAALFPITPVDPTSGERVVGVLHVVFAGGFFAAMAFMALFLFRRTTPGGWRTAAFVLRRSPEQSAGVPPEKTARDEVYTVAGAVIVTCLVLIALYWLLGRSTELARLEPVFWLESLAIVAFGIAWLVKGQTLFRDRSGVREHR